MTYHFQWNIAEILPLPFTFSWNSLWFPFLISIHHPQIYHHSQSYLKTLLIALAFFFFRKAFDCFFRQLWIAICAKFIFMMTSRDLIMNGRDFHDDRQVEIFIMTCQDFIMYWQDFYNDRSRFSCWQVEILLWTDEIFIMEGRDFHDKRSRFSWW